MKPRDRRVPFQALSTNARSYFCDELLGSGGFGEVFKVSASRSFCLVANDRTHTQVHTLDSEKKIGEYFALKTEKRVGSSRETRETSRLDVSCTRDV